MRCLAAAVPVAFATAVAAIPVAAYGGLTLAAALDGNTRAGLNASVADGAVSTSISIVVFGPIVVGLGICAAMLFGIRRWSIRVATPLALMALLSLPAALLAARIAPDPGPAQRLHEPVLAQIPPPEDATSGALTTFNASAERESLDWVSRRFDLLAPRTTASAAVRHYRRVLRKAGWHIEGVLSDTRKVSIWGRRGGHRIEVKIDAGASRRAELDLR